MYAISNSKYISMDENYLMGQKIVSCYYKRLENVLRYLNNYEQIYSRYSLSNNEEYQRLLGLRKRYWEAIVNVTTTYNLV